MKRRIKEDRASIVQRKVGLYVPTLTSFFVVLACIKQHVLILGLQLMFFLLITYLINLKKKKKKIFLSIFILNTLFRILPYVLFQLQTEGY